MEYAWQQGQLKADTPRQDLVFLLTNLVDSSSVFAQDAGSFARLEQFFTAFSRVCCPSIPLSRRRATANGQNELRAGAASQSAAGLPDNAPTICPLSDGALMEHHPR